MAAEPSLVEVTLESALKSIGVAEHITQRVCATAGFEEEEQQRIEMAVHESLINAIEHGNKGDSTKRVWIGYRIFDDRLEIRVRDQGNGFDPSVVPDPRKSENLLNVSGRGIFLIRSFMDEFRVEKVAGAGTEVTMVKRLNSKTSLIKEGT